MGNRALILTLSLVTLQFSADAEGAGRRARDLGIPFDGKPGCSNAITDVEGVLVGHSTIKKGKGKHAARTGVTAVLANRRIEPVFAAVHVHNGVGELTGAHCIDELGLLRSPIMLTNTLSVGTVHTAVVKWSLDESNPVDIVWLPVVAETWDGRLNHISGLHVKEEHAFEALDDALNSQRTCRVAEGNVGGGTGMVCHGFKGGIGTASRVIEGELGETTVGVLVQANHGSGKELRIAGAPVGRHLTGLRPKEARRPEGDGSIIIVVATDAPLLPHQLERVAKRASMGLARNGSFTSSGSGDIFVAFSTAGPSSISAADLEDWLIDEIFRATVQATEEAIINALIAAETMEGVDGNRVHALPHCEVRKILRRYNRLARRQLSR